MATSTVTHNHGPQPIPASAPRVAVRKVLSREWKTTSEIQTVRSGPGPQIHTFISWYLFLRLLGKTPSPLLPNLQLSPQQNRHMWVPFKTDFWRASFNLLNSNPPPLHKNCLRVVCSKCNIQLCLAKGNVPVRLRLGKEVTLCFPRKLKRSCLFPIQWGKIYWYHNKKITKNKITDNYYYI